jgi:hypothetical protein
MSAMQGERKMEVMPSDANERWPIAEGTTMRVLFQEETR